MRLSGLASGMDIDSMVTQLMKAKRESYDKAVQKRALVEWQQEDYRSLSSKIVDFRNNKILNTYNLSNSISAKKAEVSGNTNTITINSTTSTATGTLNVSVDQVASASSKVFSIAGKKSETLLKDLGFSSSGGNINISVNGASISVSENGTLNDLVKAINSNKDAKASAFFTYDSSSGATKLSISNTLTGSSEVSVASFSGTFTVDSKPGEDAKATINGVEFTQSSNQFEINGVNFSIKAESGTSGSTVISTVTDTSKIVETIKSFVNDYNSLIASINSELSEKKYYKYSPLTDDQKKEMEDDEVTLWQSKARSGLLRNDTILSGYASELRIAATSLIAGIKVKDSDGNDMSMSIGITSGSYSENGKLILDETKLTEALQSDPDQVIALFNARSTDESPSSTTAGVFAKMSKSSMTALTSLSKKAGTSTTSSSETAAFLESSLMGDQLRSMESRETELLRRLTDMETQYYKQFTAMETAINKMNSQSSSISSFLS